MKGPWNSLSGKYLLLGGTLLLCLAAYIAGERYFTGHMKDEGGKINIAGRQRFLSMRIVLRAHEALGPHPQELIDRYRRELSQHSREYEDILRGLLLGDAKLGLPPLHAHQKDTGALLDETTRRWRDSQKPVIEKIAGGSAGSREQLCRACHQAYENHFTRLDEVAASLEHHYDREIQRVNFFRLLVIVFFGVLTVGVVFFVRRHLLRPVKALHAAALRIEQGDLDDVAVEIRSADEVGDLGRTFNAMARNLSLLFHENAERLNELQVLNEISAAGGGSLALTPLLEAVLDALLSLETLALEKKAAIFLGDEKRTALRLAAARGFSAEQRALCAEVPFGECLCGRAVAAREVISCAHAAEDPRHTKRYVGMSDHGHLILPLASRGSLVGVLCLYLPRGTALSERREQLYRSLAGIVAVAVQNALNHRQVAMLAQSLDSSQDIIVITDLEGKIVHANPEAFRQLGYAAEELVGQPVWIMQSPENPPGLGEEIFRRTLEGGWSGELLNRRKDGRDYPVQLTTAAVRDAEGNVIALIGTARDITELRRATQQIEAARAFSDNLINGIPGVLFCFTPEGRLLRWNRMLETSLDYPREAVARMHPLEFVAPEDRARAEESIRDTFSHGQAEAELTLVASSGRRVPHHILGRRIEVEGRPALLGVGIDITERKKTEEALRRSEAGLRHAQRAASLGNWEWDIARDEASCSEEVDRIFGYLPGGFGRTFRALLDTVHPRDRELVEARMREAVTEGKSFDYDRRLVRPDGTERVVHEHGEVVRDGQGRPVRLVGTVQDVTERKLLEERLREHGVELEGKVRERTWELEQYGHRLQKLLEISSTTGLTAKEMAGLILKELAGILDVGLAGVGQAVGAEWVGYALADRVFGIREGTRTALVKTLCGVVCATREPLIIEDARASETFRDLPDVLEYGVASYLGVPLFVGGELFGTLFTAGKSPHRYTTQDLVLHQLLSKRLEYEFLREGYEHALRESTIRAETATRAKSEFLANMSHELRTPLNAILGFSEIMRDGLAGEVNAQQKEYLNDVWESGSHLLRLINDILDISKIEAGKMELEPGDVDLCRLLKETLVLYGEKAARHRINLHVMVAEELPTISADERRIKQVLINLLTNAMKFTPDGGDVGVDAAVEDEEMRVTVWDTGIGIAAEDLERLFQPFQQLESALTKTVEGTGLGLSLCRKIVELHGGRIWVESTPGAGSRFIFTIPLAPATGRKS